MAELKVGDSVRAIDQTNGWGQVKKGAIGVITYVPDHYGGEFKADFPGQDGWVGLRECFEKIENPYDKPQELPKMYKFNMGRALDGEPVVMRDGRRVIKVTKSGNDRWPLKVEAENFSHREPFFKSDGRFSNYEDSPQDLFMILSPSEAKERKEIALSLTAEKVEAERAAFDRYKKPATAETTTQEVSEMSTAKPTTAGVKGKAAVLLEKNKAAAITAAKIEAGQIAVNRITKIIQPKLPMMLRGYADTAVARIVVANLFSLAVQQYASDNAKAAIIADAMMEGAMLEFVQSFNIDQLLDQVVKGVDFSKLTSTVDE